VAMRGQEAREGDTQYFSSTYYGPGQFLC